jgi:hypothetical protein
MQRFPRLFLVASLGLLLAYATFVPAQLRPGDAKQLGSKTDLERFVGVVKIDFDNYMRGAKPPSGEEAKKLFELASQYYVFRVTWFLASGRPNPEVMENVRGAFKRVIKLAIDNADKNQAAVKLWTPMLVSDFKEVLDLPFENNRLACVNGALLLPELAKLKRPEIADLLVTLLEDPKKHDAIKRWAAEALTEFFPATEFDVVLKRGDKEAERKKQADLKRVNALLGFVKRKWNPSKNVSKEEVEAFRYVRRMTIRALGEARVPVIEADSKTQKVQGDVIHALVPILTKGAVAPEPTLPEKIEAAIAISRMRVEPNSAYQPDEGIYRVSTVLAELAVAYNNDYNRFAGGGAVKSIPVLPWRYHARRIQLALGEMVDSVKSDPLRTTAAVNARKLQSESQSLLNAMQEWKANFNAQGLADVSKTLRPPASAQIFKDIKTAPASSGQ